MVFFSSKIKQLKIFVNTFPIPGVSLLLLAAWKILAGTGGGDFCMRLLKFVSCWEAPLSENCLPLLTITFSFCAALWMFKDLTAFSLDACTLSKHFFLFYKSHLFQIRIIFFFSGLLPDKERQGSRGSWREQSRHTGRTGRLWGAVVA